MGDGTKSVVVTAALLAASVALGVGIHSMAYRKKSGVGFWLGLAILIPLVPPL
jgi:hypothetical protein